MIPVVLAGEPLMFEGNVRRRGRAFLASNPTPNSKQFSKHNYWNAASNELHHAYNGICAYTCFYLLPPWSIDHFQPKSLQPALAYEWNNLRLCSSRVNSYKGDSVAICDPILMQPGWVILDFPSCLVRIGPTAPANQVGTLQQTVQQLRLNDDDFFVQERCDLMMSYADGSVSLDFLTRRYPFLATEITRQGIQTVAADLFKRRTL